MPTRRQTRAMAGDPTQDGSAAPEPNTKTPTQQNDAHYTKGASDGDGQTDMDPLEKDAPSEAASEVAEVHPKRWTDMAIAETFADIIKDELIYQKGTLYIYFEEQWRIDHKYELTKSVLMRALRKFYEDVVEGCKIDLKQIEEDMASADRIPKDRREALGTAAIKISKKMWAAAAAGNYSTSNTGANNIISTTRTILASKLHDIEFDIGADQYYNIQLANGVLDLKTKQLRPRTKTDYVTKVLDWNYIPKDKVCKKAIETTRMIYVKIQPDEQQRKFDLGFMAYSITGNISHQLAKFNIGYKSSNGKSTSSIIHHTVFPIYTAKLDNRVFAENYEKSHKDFIQLVREPIRLAYIEELSRLKIDETRYKDFVDARKMVVEVMYGTKEEHRIQSKLLANSNNDPNFSADKAVRRRSGLQFYESVFEDIEEDDFENHRYRKEDGLENIFEDEQYKNAYLHLLLENIDELIVPESAKKWFDEMVDDRDEFKQALEILGLEITGDKKDVIPKRVFLELEEFKYKYTWPELLAEIKRVGLVYDREAKPEGRGGDRGAIRGLRERGNDKPAVVQGQLLGGGYQNGCGQFGDCNKGPDTTEMADEEKEQAWARGYRSAVQDAVLLDEYIKDKDDGYVCARVYYILHQNPEQYGTAADYWFSDGAPNMGAFRRKLRLFKLETFPNPRIPEDWDGFRRYGF